MIDLSLENILGLGLVIGLLVVVAISIRGWAKKPYRALPFIYATGAAFAWFWDRSESAAQLLQAVAVVNAVAALFLAVAWFEFKRKD